MNKISILIAFLALTISFTGCEKELITPQSEAPEMQAFLGFDYPSNPCGAPDFHTLEDLSSTVMGSVEILNDQKYLYLFCSMSHGYVVAGGQAFAGKQQDLPLNARDQMDYENFPFKPMFSRPQNTTTIRIPLDNLGSCFDLAVRLEIAELDLFGNTMNDKVVWLSGRSFKNGLLQNYCQDICR